MYSSFSITLNKACDLQQETKIAQAFQANWEIISVFHSFRISFKAGKYPVGTFLTVTFNKIGLNSSTIVDLKRTHLTVTKT